MTDTLEQNIDDFLALEQFVVAGASTNRAKYGNKILRCYLQNNREAIPLNPRAEEIEGLSCIASLAEIVAPKKTGLSIITPPKISAGLIDEAIELGIPALWIQPGAEEEDAIERARKAGLTVIANGPCLLVVLGYREI